MASSIPKPMHPELSPEILEFIDGAIEVFKGKLSMFTDNRSAQICALESMSAVIGDSIYNYVMDRFSEQFDRQVRERTRKIVLAAFDRFISPESGTL